MALKAPYLVGLVAAFALVAVGVNSCANAVNSVERGADYLESKGYKNVTGGDRVYMFHTCGKNAFVREYTAEKDNKKTEQKVCFGLFGPHLPWF